MTLTVNVTTIRAESVTQRSGSKMKGKPVRFSLLGHFQRACPFPPHHHFKNDELSSWRSLFFYLCTDTISFAPLKSQGVDSRLNGTQEKTIAATPPPCSPKSAYILASLVSQASKERLRCNANSPNQVRNPAPL